MGFDDDFSTCELCDNSYYEGYCIDVKDFQCFNTCIECGDKMYNMLLPHDGNVKVHVEIPNKRKREFEYVEAAEKWANETDLEEDTEVWLEMSGKKTKADYGLDDVVAILREHAYENRETINKWRATEEFLEFIKKKTEKRVEYELKLLEKTRQNLTRLKARIENEVLEAESSEDESENEKPSEEITNEKN
jgi:hypothetical protein